LEWDDYTPEIRLEVLDLLVAVHTAPPEVRDRARPEDHAIQFRENLAGGRADPGLGPYARPAAELLHAHLPEIRRAVARHDDLAGLARAEGNGPVLTHGEPHPGNAMRTGDGLVLIDWDTALAAPPERDLWHLDPGDGSVHAAYTAATGTVPRPEVVELYRLRWDLTEIAQAVARFREPHGGTADDDETLANLEESITNVAAAR
ncbi:phosphotransferase, partial [Actinoplanes sp. NPDC051633]|uniref:phosphotransferase family protein n=1 Tax=Actinoplanes sp. NPDC051633 TaxID=3155670 RepID=UPI00344894ED